MHRLLIALSFVACTATVRSTGTTGPTEPMPPPPPPSGPATRPAPPPPGPVVTAPPPAPGPQQHPAYGALIRDLRQARALLARTPGQFKDVRFDEQVALREIDDAIKEIREAKADSGIVSKDMPVTIDEKMMYRDRLREAARALDNVARNLEQEPETNVWARGDRKQAIQHTRRAWTAVNEAIADRADATQVPPAGPPAAHPAYMAAIGNLRQARALLERPTGAADVKWDEHTAIKDIDEAFEEIRKARVDDGKPMTEHPPIESGLVYRDRLKEAEKQLHEAQQDLDSREDNFWAKKDRRRAVDAIRRAEKATHEAMADRKEDKAEKKEEKREEKADKKAAKGH